MGESGETVGEDRFDTPWIPAANGSGGAPTRSGPAGSGVGSGLGVGSGSGSRSGVGSASGAALDPVDILNRLALEQNKPSRNTQMNNTIIVMAGFVVLLVIGSFFGALYLKDQVNANGSGGVVGSNGTTQKSLNQALAAARKYAAHAGPGALAANPLGFFSLIPAKDNVEVATASDSGSEVAVQALSGSAVLFTSLQPVTQVCYGVVDVFAVQASPALAGFEDTSQPGVYYFVAPVSSPSICLASAVRPTGPQDVSSGGYPTAMP